MKALFYSFNSNVSKKIYWVLLAVILPTTAFSRSATPPSSYTAFSITITTQGVSYDYWNGFAVFYNGSINVVASGGTAPYTYVVVGWYTQNSGYFSLMQPGTYQIQVTDAAGQVATGTAVVATAYPVPAAKLVKILHPSGCNTQDGSLTIRATGGTAPYLYSIDGGATFGPDSTFTNMYPGYYPACLVQDANGMVAACATSPILIYGSDSLFFNCNCCTLKGYSYPGVVSSCNDNTGQVDVGATGGTLPYEFSIDNVNYYPGQPNYGGQYRFGNLAPGNYTGYVKDGAGNFSLSETTITKFCMIVITYIGIDASCGGGSDGGVTITATNGVSPYQYTIDGINFQASNTFAGLAAGTYNVTVKDATGMLDSRLVTVYDKCPTVSAAATDEHCGGHDGTITATGAKGTLPYVFSLDGVNFQASNVFAGLSAGQYTVTMKDGSGFTTTAKATVNTNCLQLSLAGANATCGESNGTITASGSGGIDPYQYSIDGTDFQFQNVFTGLGAGNYTVTLLDGNGEITTANVTLTASPGPQTTVATVQASCDNTGGGITILVTGGTTPYAYSIDGGNSFQSTGNFTGLDSGTYKTVVQDASGCAVSQPSLVTALPTPAFSLGNDTSICAGQSFLLTGPNGNSYSYQWQDKSIGNTVTVTASGTYTLTVTNGYNCSATSTVQVTTILPPDFTLGNDTTVCAGQQVKLQTYPLTAGTYLWNTGGSQPDITTGTPGLYWLQITSAGCSKRDSIFLYVTPVPDINLGGDTTVCEGQVITLDAASPNATYQWQDGSTAATYQVDKPGVYTVSVSEAGCDTAASITVDYDLKPVVSLGDTTLCITQTLKLNAASPGASYEWQDGSILPQFLVTVAGDYSVKVTNGCGTTTASAVVQFENCDCKFYVPSGFSPNNDGNNDVFRPKYICLFSNYNLKVFSRWGQLLFASGNPGEGWDGNFKGMPQVPGTYVWEMSYHDNLTGRNTRKTGTVVLVR